MSLNESFHEHGRHDVLLGMTGRVKQMVTQSWQGQQPDAAPVNRGTLHCDGSIDKEQLTNQMSDAAPVNLGTLHCDGSIDKVQATNPLSQDKKSELGMSKTITSEVGTEGRPIHANVVAQAVGTQSGNDDVSENELLSGRDDKSEASYERTHGSKRSDVGEEYSALSAIAGGQSKGAGTKVRLPSHMLSKEAAALHGYKAVAKMQFCVRLHGMLSQEDSSCA